MNVTVVVWLLDIPAVLAVIHAATRSASAWAAADRNRGFWLFFLVFAALLSACGLPFVIAYAVGVAPRLRAPLDTEDPGNPFTKRRP